MSESVERDENLKESGSKLENPESAKNFTKQSFGITDFGSINNTDSAWTLMSPQKTGVTPNFVYPIGGFQCTPLVTSATALPDQIDVMKIEENVTVKPLTEVITGEENEENLVEAMGTLYVFTDEKKWVSLGKGCLRLNQGQLDGKEYCRIVVRSFLSKKCLVNSYVWKEMKVGLMSHHSAIFGAINIDTSKAEVYAFKTSVALAKNILVTLQKYVVDQVTDNSNGTSTVTNVNENILHAESSLNCAKDDVNQHIMDTVTLKKGYSNNKEFLSHLDVNTVDSKQPESCINVIKPITNVVCAEKSDISPTRIESVTSKFSLEHNAPKIDGNFPEGAKQNVDDGERLTDLEGYDFDYRNVVSGFSVKSLNSNSVCSFQNDKDTYFDLIRSCSKNSKMHNADIENAPSFVRVDRENNFIFDNICFNSTIGATNKRKCSKNEIPFGVHVPDFNANAEGHIPKNMKDRVIPFSCTREAPFYCEPTQDRSRSTEYREESHLVENINELNQFDLMHNKKCGESERKIKNINHRKQASCINYGQHRMYNEKYKTNLTLSTYDDGIDNVDLNYDDGENSNNVLNYNNEDLDNEDMNYDDEEITNEFMNYNDEEIDNEQINNIDEEIYNEHMSYDDGDIDNEHMNYDDEDIDNEDVNYNDEEIANEFMNYSDEDMNYEDEHMDIKLINKIDMDMDNDFINYNNEHIDNEVINYDDESIDNDFINYNDEHMDDELINKIDEHVENDLINNIDIDIYNDFINYSNEHNESEVINYDDENIENDFINYNDEHIDKEVINCDYEHMDYEDENFANEVMIYYDEINHRIMRYGEEFSDQDMSYDEKFFDKDMSLNEHRTYTHKNLEKMLFNIGYDELYYQQNERNTTSEDEINIQMFLSSIKKGRHNNYKKNFCEGISADEYAGHAFNQVDWEENSNQDDGRNLIDMECYDQGICKMLFNNIAENKYENHSVNSIDGVFGGKSLDAMVFSNPENRSDQNYSINLMDMDYKKEIIQDCFSDIFHENILYEKQDIGKVNEIQKERLNIDENSSIDILHGKSNCDNDERLGDNINIENNFDYIKKSNYFSVDVLDKCIYDPFQKFDGYEGLGDLIQVEGIHKSIFDGEKALKHCEHTDNEDCRKCHSESFVALDETLCASFDSRVKLDNFMIYNDDKIFMKSNKSFNNESNTDLSTFRTDKFDHDTFPLPDANKNSSDSLLVKEVEDQAIFNDVHGYSKNPESNILLSCDSKVCIISNEKSFSNEAPSLVLNENLFQNDDCATNNSSDFECTYDTENRKRPLFFLDPIINVDLAVDKDASSKSELSKFSVNLGLDSDLKKNVNDAMVIDHSLNRFDVNNEQYNHLRSSSSDLINNSNRVDNNPKIVPSLSSSTGAKFTLTRRKAKLLDSNTECVSTQTFKPKCKIDGKEELEGINMTGKREQEEIQVSGKLLPENKQNEVKGDIKPMSIIPEQLRQETTGNTSSSCFAGSTRINKNICSEIASVHDFKEEEGIARKRKMAVIRENTGPRFDEIEKLLSNESKEQLIRKRIKNSGVDVDENKLVYDCLNGILSLRNTMQFIKEKRQKIIRDNISKNMI